MKTQQQLINKIKALEADCRRKDDLLSINGELIEKATVAMEEMLNEISLLKSFIATKDNILKSAQNNLADYLSKKLTVSDAQRTINHIRAALELK